MTIRRITITYDDEAVTAERALSIAQITEYSRAIGNEDGPLPELYAAYMSGMAGYVVQKRTGTYRARPYCCIAR